MYRAAVEATTIDDLRRSIYKRLNKYNNDEHSKIDWLHYNIKGQWVIKDEDFWFEDKDDCMAFILRWL